jgi:hypothetical protein
MNHAELDRLLCERLNIEPEKYGLLIVADSEGEVLGNPISEDIVEWVEPRLSHGLRVHRGSPKYPALSTTGDGMLVLMHALRSFGYYPQIVGGDNGYAVRIGASIIGGHVTHILIHIDQETAPRALAIAAAWALGIEVPE